VRRALAVLALLAGCREIYTDPATGFSVQYNQRHHRGVGLSLFGIVPFDGDRGEPGTLNPAVIEYVFGAAEGPFARYYDLVLRIPDKPPAVTKDLAALGQFASGRDYARALGRRLAPYVNEAMAIPGSRFDGTAGVYWGLPADLDAGILLANYERDGWSEMRTTIVRYESVKVVVVHSSGMREMLAWDVSAVPGAFDRKAKLDYDTVAAKIVPLHPVRP
jgi:hypothetical protein